MSRFALLVFAGALAAHVMQGAAADLTVYDDQTRNGFDQSCSYGGVAADFKFDNVAPVHSGAASVRLTPESFDAISWCAPMALATTDYSAITFWVNGGATGGQDLELFVFSSRVAKASASLATLLGAPVPANAWAQVTLSFDAVPYAGSFDQIAIQSNTNAAQPDVYFDDVALTGRAPANDSIFRNGFEAAAGAAPIAIENAVTACGGRLAERYTWTDAAGLARTATLTHNDTNTNAAHEGELCDYTYHTDAATVREVKSLDASGAGGFGYVVSHLYNTAPADQVGQDDSPLGHDFKGTFTRLLDGRHHAILRFQLNYPRYYCTLSNPPVDGNCVSATTTYAMPTTIEWLIATGRDHPLWSVSYDLSGAPQGAIDADSRAPYGDMAFDGDAAGGFGDTVMGVAWGDHYRFATTGATPVSFNSTWDWSAPNSVPFVYLWTQNVDAEMGVVQSEDIAKQDAGGYYGQAAWTHDSSANIGTCAATPGGGGNYTMPCDFNWPYQSINYSLDTGQPNDTTADKRLAWGAEFGFLGQKPYAGNDGTDRDGWPRQSYSTHVVLGLHSLAPTTAQRIEVENAMSSALSASLGTVLTSGPAGVNRADTRTYQPAGYDRVYGTWDANVAANAATLTLNAAGAGLNAPIFVLHGYDAGLPSSVTFDNAPLVADVDYYATLDAANQRLWITVARRWTGSHTLAVSP